MDFLHGDDDRVEAKAKELFEGLAVLYHGISSRIHADRFKVIECKGYRHV